jgi:hypothetical protein
MGKTCHAISPGTSLVSSPCLPCARRRLAAIAVFAATLIGVTAANAQNDVANQREQDGINCAITGICDQPNLSTGQTVVIQWSALAISDTTLRAGASHGQASEDAAQQTALDNCHRQGAMDCKVITAASSACLALAVSVSDRDHGFSPGSDRVQAASNALRQCRNYGGKSCTLVVSPCPSDDPRWSSPLPLPWGAAATKVDAATTGTWALTINPGRWEQGFSISSASRERPRSSCARRSWNRFSHLGPTTGHTSLGSGSRRT